MMCHRVMATAKGVVVEGRLIVLAEENDGLIYIGEEFLDDLLRERFGPSSGSDKRAVESPIPVEVDRIRMVIEVMDDPSGKAEETSDSRPAGAKTTTNDDHSGSRKISAP